MNVHNYGEPTACHKSLINEYIEILQTD